MPGAELLVREGNYNLISVNNTFQRLKGENPYLAKKVPKKQENVLAPVRGIQMRPSDVLKRNYAISSKNVSQA